MLKSILYHSFDMTYNLSCNLSKVNTNFVFKSISVHKVVFNKHPRSYQVPNNVRNLAIFQAKLLGFRSHRYKIGVNGQFIDVNRVYDAITISV
jgi:hypothetical protein